MKTRSLILTALCLSLSLSSFCRGIDTAAEIQSAEMDEFVEEFSGGYVDSREATCATASFALGAFLAALAAVFLIDLDSTHLHSHSH